MSRVFFAAAVTGPPSLFPPGVPVEKVGARIADFYAAAATPSAHSSTNSSATSAAVAPAADIILAVAPAAVTAAATAAAAVVALPQTQPPHPRLPVHNC